MVAKKPNKRVMSIIALVLVGLVAISYIYFNKDELRVVKEMDRIFLLPMVFLTIIHLGVNGVLTKIFVQAFGIELSLRDWLFYKIRLY